MNREISDLSSEALVEISTTKSLTSVEITDLSGYTSSELSREITDLSNYTSTELARQITDLSSYTSTELSTEIADLSSETVRDISDLSDSFMTAFMDGGVAFVKFNDLSSGLHFDFNDLSSSIYEYADDISYDLYTETVIRSNETTIIDLSINRIDTELTDLSNYTSSELTRQILDLSGYTSSELTRQITDVSSYTSIELSRKILDLSSETVRDISDLSSLTFNTISVDILDLSNYNSSELTRQVTDLSSYTSSELSREISDLSSESLREVSDLSSLVFHTLSTEISDLSSDTSIEIRDLSSYTSSELSREISDLSSESLREVSDLSSLVFHTLSTEISDLSSDTSIEISNVQALTSSEITDLSGYTSSELTRQITDISNYTSSELSREISDLSSETVRDITDLSNYTSSELYREISTLSSETVRDISDLSEAVFTRINVEIAGLLDGAPETLDTLKEIADVIGNKNDPSFNLATIINFITDTSANLRSEINRAVSVELVLDTKISDLSNYTSSELTRQIIDLSGYTSSELSREISDLSSETLREVSDLSSLVFHTLSTEISDLSSDTSIEIRDLSSYTSSELSREISDLSSESLREVSDLSSLVFHTLSTEISDLSSDTSIEISNVQALTSSEIADLSGYTSSELTRQITDISDYTSSELSREISDLSSETLREVSDLSNYVSSELSREISDLSSESIRDISDLSSLVFQTIANNIGDNDTVFTNVDASFVAINNLLSTEILDLSSEVVRDISDLSSQVYQTIDDLPWDYTTDYLYTASNTQNVGIGTSTPTSTLQVRSTDTSGSSIMIQSRASSGTSVANLFLTDRDESNGNMFNGFGLRYQQSKTFFDNYYVSTTSSQFMTFDHANSNIGVNTDTPTADFEVNGDLKITGALIDACGNTFANLNSAFVDTNNGVELELFTGATTTNKLYNDNGVLSFNGSAVAPTNLQFPYIDGSRNQVLETDGSGNLQWVDNHDIYITTNPLHDTYNGIGYTGIIKSFSEQYTLMAYAELNAKRYIYTVKGNGREIWRYDIDTTSYIQVAGGTDTTDNGNPYTGLSAGYVGTSRFFLISDIKFSKYDNYLYIGNDDYSTGASSPGSLMRLNPYTNYTSIVVANTTITGANFGDREGPQHIQFDLSGNVYYGCTLRSYGVKKFDIQTMTQSAFINPGEFPGTYTWSVIWDNSNNAYLIHSYGMAKLSSVSGVDLSYNNSSVYFGTNTHLGGNSNERGNIDDTGTTARVQRIMDVVKDPVTNDFYVATGIYGNSIKKVTPNASNSNVGDVTTIAGSLDGTGNNSSSLTVSDYPTTNPTNTSLLEILSVEFDSWGNLVFLSSNNNVGHLMYYAGIPYTRTGTQPVLPGDSITRLSDISLNNIQYGEFLIWNGESIVPGEAPNGGRGSTIPNLNFTKSNIKDVSQNMLFNSNSKYLLLDKRITIDKIRINQKNRRPLTVGYNVYINEYYDNSGTLQNVQSKTIENAVVGPVITGETYGSTIVDISATSFTNRNYLEVLIERSSNYVYNESTNTIARFNFFPYVNQYLNNVDISDNLNGSYNLGVKSINHVIEDDNTGCIIIGDSSDNYLRIPAENGSSIDIKAVSFWIKNWTGGYIVDGRNVINHSQLTSNAFVEYGSPNDISAGNGISKFVNQDNVPYETVGIGGDPSDNSISILHKDGWNFVYIEFDASGSFTSSNPLLFGTSIYGDGGSYTMKDLRLHSDSILTNDIENLFNHYDDNDIMVELITTPVERTINDLSDVSSINIVSGEFLKFDGTHYVPTNDVADISSTVTDLSGYTYNMTINDLCDCVVTTNSYFIGSSTSRGEYTTVFGYEAMDQSDDSGLQHNTAIGYRALYNTTSGQADRNTAIGSGALSSVQAGWSNTVVGYNAANGQESSNSVILGDSAGDDAQFNRSIVIGTGAARKVGQNYSIFIGDGAGNTTASGLSSRGSTMHRNIVIGTGNMSAMTTAYDNVIIGGYSSNNLTTGYQNVIIGSNSTTNASTTNNLPVDISNAIGIGYESYPSASNTIQLGNTNHTNINTSATLTLGEITLPNTDGSQNTFLTTDGSGNLSFTNYEIKPHVTNVTFDGSNAVIIEFSRDISNVSTYSPDDFSVVHDGSSISVLSVYESTNNLVLNLGSTIGGSSSGSSSSSSSQALSSQIYYESFDNEDVTLESTHDTVYVTGSSGSGKALSTIGQSPNGYQWIQKTSNSTLPTSIRSASFYLKIPAYGHGKTIFDNREDDGTDQGGGIFWLHFDTLKYKSTDSGTYGTASGGGFLPTGDQINLYVDGVGPQLYKTTDNPTGNGLSFLNIITSGTATGKINICDNNWHHFYIEWPNNEVLIEFKWLSLCLGSYNIEAAIDELRYFNTALTTSQISNLAAGGNGNTSSSSSSSSSSSTTDPSAVDVPIDLDKLKFTYTKSVDGSNNIITTDGVRVKSFYYNGLGLTNIESETLGDLSNVDLTDISDGHYLRYNESSSSWLVSNLPNDNSSNIIVLDQEVSDLSSLVFNTLTSEITDLSNYTSSELSRETADLSSIVFNTLSIEIYDLSQETLSDIEDLSSALHQKINVDISAVIGGAGPALDTLKELEDYVTGLSGNTVAGLVTDLIDLSNNLRDLSNVTPVIFNDLNDVNVSSIGSGKLVKWDGSNFTETQLLYSKPSDGYIGIGISNPSFPLTVDSYTTTNVSNIGYLDQSGVSVVPSAQNSEISIYASKGIWTGTSFYASSDMRIKKFIVDLVPSACMTFVRELKAKKYNFVDHIKHGSKEVYGFIAQDVKNICPNVVTTQQEFVPDIFKAVENITWTKVDKKWKLTILDDSIEIKPNTTVRFYVSDRKNSEIMKDVVNCRYDSKSFLFDKIYEDIFIYGHRVDDFLALDKEQLFTLHHGAIQSLDTNQQSLNDEIKQLKEENKSLKSIVNTLQKQLETVISHLGI